MPTLFTYVLTLWLAAGAAPVVQSAEPRVLASTPTWTITTDDYEAILNSLPEQTRAVSGSPENRRSFLDDLIQIWVLAEQGRQKGVDKEPPIRAMVNFYGNNIIAREHRNRIEAAVTVTPEAVEAFYKENPDNFTRVRISHILVANGDSPIVKERNIEGALPLERARARIEEVKAKIQSGASFEELAKEYSQDPGSAENGGDLGYISKGQLTGAVEKAAFTLAPETFSDIIESPFGFHILYLKDRMLTPFDEVQEQIRMQIITDKVNKEVAAQMDAAGVKVDEEFFKTK